MDCSHGGEGLTCVVCREKRAGKKRRRDQREATPQQDVPTPTQFSSPTADAGDPVQKNSKGMLSYCSFVALVSAF